MLHFLETIWRIALLRAGPQDLPPGGAAPTISVAMYICIVTISGLTDERAAGFSDLFVSIVVPLVAAGSILGLRRAAARFNQTVAALFGTGTLISLVNLPLWFSAQTPLPAPLVMLALIALFWSLAVDGHVWRNALDCSFAGGLMVAVLILVLQLLVFQAMGNPGVS
ncbi:MAG TPA: hypothetical protein VJ908_10480 [Wenzhouxiangellaceae bacterium]|nr:hypothetical protein [Wenzhouxiangellaceae bacterium]